jgi:hypothetical protein
MRISHRHRLVFVSVPRSGSTSVRRVLDPHCEVHSVHVSRADARFPFYHHVSALELLEHFERRGWAWNEYRKFAVARNPFDRAVSLFHHHRLIRAGRVPGLAPATALWRRVTFPLRARQTFADFVRHTLPTSSLARPLLGFMADRDGELLVDDILRLETLDEELPDYLRGVGIHLDDDAVPRINRTPNRAPFPSYYDEETRRVVAEHYADEVRRFGYDFGADTS